MLPAKDRDRDDALSEKEPLTPNDQRCNVTLSPCRLFVTGVCRVMLCAASGFVLASFIIHAAPTEKLQ